MELRLPVEPVDLDDLLIRVNEGGDPGSIGEIGAQLVATLDHSNRMSKAGAPDGRLSGHRWMLAGRWQPRAKPRNTRAGAWAGDS
jgi:hypothetical protein